MVDHGVRIKHYHADIGQFTDNAFKQHCNQQQQTITYCSVSTHFQNGLVSPQFHCRFDNFFETTKHSEQDIMTSANWKQLTGFVKYDGSTTVQDKLSSADNLLVPVGTNQGHPADYVGITIAKHGNGCVEFTQRALIDTIINEVHLEDAYTKPVPAKAKHQLHAFKDSTPFDECNFNFNYCSVVGKLNYLGQTTRSDIVFATHQIAKYSSDPRKEHGEAILYLVQYLKKTRHLGLKFNPNPSKGFEWYCDADFAGNWNRDFAQVDPSTAKSRSG
ncbi:hypothetical protein ACHAW6_007722 [Cyclotella cf. meneghiniana]